MILSQTLHSNKIYYTETHYMDCLRRIVPRPRIIRVDKIFIETKS